jgi:hypothetical protein
MTEWNRGLRVFDVTGRRRFSPFGGQALESAPNILRMYLNDQLRSVRELQLRRPPHTTCGCRCDLVSFMNLPFIPPAMRVQQRFRTCMLNKLEVRSRRGVELFQQSAKTPTIEHKNNEHFVPFCGALVSLLTAGRYLRRFFRRKPRRLCSHRFRR